LGDARILVAPEVVVGVPPGKTVVAVCDTPFDNVPRRWIEKASPTHAVAYADGSAGLLTLDEFRRLDLRACLKKE
jgi:hypothetical protein